MIRVICNQETFVYNAYHMVKAFYPSETVTSSVDEKASNYVTVEFAEDGTDGQKEAMIEIADRQTNDMPAEKSAMKKISRPDVIQKVVRAKWQNSCMGNPDGSTTD